MTNRHIHKRKYNSGFFVEKNKPPKQARTAEAEMAYPSAENTALESLDVGVAPANRREMYNSDAIVAENPVSATVE